MPRPTALIVDDEANLRRHLRKQLDHHWPELVICAEAGDGNAALEAYARWQPDFVFLDIKMPGLNGMEVAGTLAPDTHIVFVTAYDQFAVEAFEKSAVDYLLKPVSDERLLKTIDRLKRHNAIHGHSPLPPAVLELLKTLDPAPHASRYLQWIKASHRGQIHLLAVEEIDYFQSADKYTTVVTQDGEWVIRTALKSLESELDPDRFWRIHRSVIVRVQAIEQYRKTFSGRAIVKLHGHPTPLPVSRRYADIFKAD